VATIYREFDVEAPVHKVWEAISDVGAVNKLITFLGEVTLVGDRRTCELGDMGKLEELIVTVDEENRRVAYSIRESPFNMLHHSASMQTFPNGNDGSKFVWITDVYPDEAAGPQLVDAVDASVESIKAALRA
jgi:carbon monoxide dehydrogenase subunit G